MKGSLPLSFAVLLLPVALGAQAGIVGAPAPDVAKADVHGRVEDLGGGLELLRVWGTPGERGYAHGRLLGDRIASTLIAEFSSRFGNRKGVLEMARSSLKRLIEYPKDIRAEIEALYDGLVDSGADRSMPQLGRAFDLDDLLVANALDVFGMLGCSGFSVWGDHVVGGGVLTGRNFDWPLTGPHLLGGTILLVEERPDGPATASVCWPGYVGAVTGINSEGVAVFLHVGSARIRVLPEPESWPTAVAARRILEDVRVSASAAKSAELAGSLLSYTSPPAGYLTRVVLPRSANGEPPVLVFETDSRRSVVRRLRVDYSVVTNHFATRTDGRKASRDSLGRAEKLSAGVEGCLTDGDEKVDIEEMWRLLTRVDRGRRHFGTLHSLVFRHDPWHFELRVAAIEHGRIVPATRSRRRHLLTRNQIFRR